MMCDLMNSERMKPAPIPSEPQSGMLTRQAARSFLWVLSQTAGSKIFSFGTQVALARLLLPRDFGLIALAYTAVAFTGLIRQTGIQQILVQRHKHFRRWVNPAFWFELTVGIATALLLTIASPIAALVFHSRALIGLILVIAAAAPLSPWFVIPTARLMIDMRFKAIAAVNITYNSLAMALSIFLAWRGFGAYSFVIPLPIAGAIRALWLWKLAQPRINGNPQFRRWKFLLGDSGYMLATGFVGAATIQSGSLALGLMYSKAVVGQFYLAFNISTQVSQLLSQNIGNVLMPAFSRIQSDHARQIAALLRSSRSLSFISTPLCLLLAAVSKPLIVLAYGEKWLPAAPVLQLMAIAMSLNIPNAAAYAALQSQGRFRVVFLYTLLQAPAFIAGIFVAARLAAAVGVALGWVAMLAFAAPVCIRLALGEGGKWGDVAGIYFRPLAAGAASVAPVMLLVHFLPGLAGRYALQFGISTAWLLIAYPVLGRALCPTEVADIRSLCVATFARPRKRITPANNT